MSPPGESEVPGFLLSREWRDGRDGVDITLWAWSELGPIKATFPGQEAVFFAPRDAHVRSGRRTATEFLSRDGSEVDAHYFRSQRALRDERDRLYSAATATFESDVKPADRFLMELFITGGLSMRGPCRHRHEVLHFDRPTICAAEVEPRLRVLSIDLETDGYDGPLLSAAVAGEGLERVLIRREGRDHDGITFHPDERTLLSAFFDEVSRFDPDVVIGWNVVEFDLRTLAARCAASSLPFALGRGGERARVLEGDRAQRLSLARIPGRVVLDGIATLKSATWSFERYTLEHVARSLLGRGKRIVPTRDPVEEIRRMHRDDPRALAEYNLEDCRLVLDIFAKAELLRFATERARLTGLPMDRPGGSVAAFDHLYLPRLHRRGFVAPDVGIEIESIPSPGGYVLDSVPGLYSNVLAFDFRSLYPSIIQTFHVDPLALWQPGDDPIAGFDGASFARRPAILSEMVATLTEARSRAHRSGNAALSRAIKILMNSLYGVLGTPGCRFFDSRLASSITRRGHEIIELTRADFAARGFSVIYGDTDSLFVLAPEKASESECAAIGEKLAAETNDAWRTRIEAEYRVDSQLHLRFEAHYLRFLMPTVRGSERGSKKRYAGTLRSEDGSIALVIRGLEAIRSDWVQIARDMQRELLLCVLTDKEYAAWLRALRGDLLAGKLDEGLVYRRRLRRDLDQYGSEPPHVRAARMVEEAGPIGNEIEYVMTVRGAEPASMRTARLDYAHYIDKQLAPAADVVLTMLGTSWQRVAGAQLSLF